MFINGVLLGIALGVTFIYYWRIRMRQRRAELFQQASNNTKLVNLMKSAQVEKLIGHPPKWIALGEYDQVEWLNAQLKELWPYVNLAVQDTIRESVEPELKNYKPAGVSSMEFTKTDLGSNAPKITGVRVFSLDKKQAIMDMDITWQGNCRFELAIKTVTMASVSPCVNNLSFTGTLRLILEFTDSLSVVAAYLAAIKRRGAPPDYDLKCEIAGAGLGAVPGITTMVDTIIRNSIDDMLLWPKRIVGAVVENYDISHLEFLYSGAVVVTVEKGEQLKNTDTFGKSDPRAMVYLKKTHRAATKFINNNLNPVWQNEVFELPVDDVHTAILYIEVQDSDGLAGIETMGFASLPLEDVLWKTEETRWRLQLYNSLNAGERTEEELGFITISVIYKSFETDSEKRSVTKRESERATQQLTDVEDVALTPSAAADAKQRALASARNRQQNMDAFQGTAVAAGVFVQLHKDLKADAECKKGDQSKPGSGAQGAGQEAKAPVTPGDAPRSSGPAAATPPKAGKFASVVNEVASSGTLDAAASAVQDAPSTTTAALEPNGLGPVAVTLPPVIPPVATVDTDPASRDGGVVVAPEDAETLAAAAATAYGIQSEEDRSGQGRHKVSNFFKGVGQSITHGLKGAAPTTDSIAPQESLGVGERPPTPKRHGLGLFKHKDRKASEV